ncbi:MAG: cytochrome c oxidase subunit 3 [Acidimicrobiales bacterium]|jgi:cytochrome c oxidase subunit 3|nr:cytochrome c oxidase subunit 3 [Acidimicrobiales bacterium]
MAVATRPPADVAPGGAPALPAAEGPIELPDGKGATALAGLLFLVADTMVLGGLLAVFFAVRGQAPAFPPRDTHPGVYVPVVICFTAFLAAMSAQWAVVSARRDDRRNGLVSLAMTLGFMLAIANIQTYAYRKLGFSVTKHAYASLYYLLTGFHLANVVIAAAMLVVAFARVAAGHVHPDADGPVRAAARFTQYVNLVYLAVFIAIYVVA